MRRPTGVAIIALLTGISGLVLTIGGLFWFFFFAADLGGFPPVAILVRFVILGAASVFLAWGTWNLKTWAWTIQVILQVLGVVADISRFKDGWFDPLMWGWLLVGILILYYLLRPSVRVAFGRAQPHTQ